MGKVYHCTLEVRGYELDSYGHVNHAVYLNYLEQARWKLLQEEKIQLSDFARWQRWPVVAEIQAKYLRPTFMGDLLEVRTRIAESTKTSFVFEQEVFREEARVFAGQVRAVIVNEKGRPADMPAEIQRFCQKGAETP